MSLSQGFMSQFDYRIQEILPEHCSAEQITEWALLSQDVENPNPFYEPWMLIPAFSTLKQGEQVSLLFVYSVAADKELLVGFMPLSKTRGYYSVPLSVVRNWRHCHCFLGNPLVKRGHENLFSQALLAYLDQCGSSLLELEYVYETAQNTAQLMQELQRTPRPYFVYDRYERAALHSHLSGPEYLDRALSKKRKKEFRRKRNRLAELGEVHIELLDHGGNPGEWINEFLALEVSGWKGREGTALSCREEDVQFFSEIIHAAWEREALQFLRLRVEGKSIAMLCNFISGDSLFSFKVAFDERYSKLSPGVLLEKEFLLLNQNGSQFNVDSCATPGNFMIEQLWQERIALCRCTISSKKALARTIVPAFKQIRSLHTTIRKGLSYEQVHSRY